MEEEANGREEAAAVALLYCECTRVAAVAVFVADTAAEENEAAAELGVGRGDGGVADGEDSVAAAAVHLS